MKIDGVIYLDHQATCPLDSTVFAEMVPYFEGRFGNPHSSDHAVGWRASQAVQRAASEVARLIGADPDEIIFTSGATGGQQPRSARLSPRRFSEQAAADSPELH